MTTFDSRVLAGQTSDEGGGSGGTTIELDINLVGVHDVTKAYSAGDGVRFNDGLIYIATADVAANGASPPNAPWGRYSGPTGRDGSATINLDPYARLDGATFTGNVVVPVPDAEFEATHKGYVDAAVTPVVFQVADNAALARLMANARQSTQPLWAQVSANARATVAGTTLAFSVGDLIYFPPRTEKGQRIVNIPAPVENAGNAKAVDLQVRTINTAVQLIAFLNAQQNSDTPAIVHFTLGVTEVFNGETHTFKTDDVVYFPPKSVVSKTIPLPEPNVGGNIGIVPKNIADIASIDGDYVLGVAALDVEHLKRLGVDQYEIWFKDEAVHTVDPWAPVADFTVSFNVSSSEETQIGLKDGDRIVPIRLVFRSGGTFVDWLSGFLTIGDDMAGGDAAELTDVQKALDLGAYLETPVVERASAAIEGPWRINFDNPTALPDSGYWFTIDVEGQPATQGRVAWAQASSASFTIATAVAEAIFQGAGAKRAIELNLYFYTAAAGRASDYVARLRYGVAFLTAKAANILQVAVDGGDAAGVASIVLPATYDSWKRLSLGIWEANSDDIDVIEIPTAIIKAQTVNRDFRIYGGRNNQQVAMITWVVATRTMDPSGNDRIIYAELTDD